MRKRCGCRTYSLGRPLTVVRATVNSKDVKGSVLDVRTGLGEEVLQVHAGSAGRSQCIDSVHTNRQVVLVGNFATKTADKQVVVFRCCRVGRNVVERLQARRGDRLSALGGDVGTLGIRALGGLPPRGLDDVVRDLACRRGDELRGRVDERDVVAHARRERVREGAEHRRVRLFVNIAREVGVEQGVRLLRWDLDRDQVACRGRGRGLDAVLAQPVVNGLQTLGLGSDELLDLPPVSTPSSYITAIRSSVPRISRDGGRSSRCSGH